ncbi:LacI family transcriptional regulator [Paenibacillus taihuensis]|uniref:LacI family transcriptional regulator n=1 Tax=Paenibacillus taihuensis TaxID=1156355 RepID=A0A3D9RHQ3_9BACL|nr:LacI family DNA-binding transcriptional regulator [Paenibacillus taihuensis]REE78648.1 LacI family transcriptional regulator [Paenibacillus taihuensis]
MTKQRKVTLEMIANEIGVTKVTISKALNNQPGVSEELKKTILRISHELGYIHKKAEKNQKGITKLGLLVPKRFFLDTDNFYTQIYYHMNRDCALKDINLALYVLNPEEEKKGTLPLSIHQDSANIGGLFVAGEVSDSYMELLSSSLSVPIVAIDFYKRNETYDCIVTDNYRAGYTAASYVANKGHKRIGFVGNPNYTSSVMDRFCGYVKALTEFGLEYRKDWHIVNNDEDGAYINDFALPEELPTAFVCHCDMAAYKLLVKLQGQGINVPEQVSIISFDNTDLSQSIVTALTTMDISKSALAEKALERMLWRVEHTNEEPQHIYVNTRLIERDSVAAL